MESESVLAQVCSAIVNDAKEAGTTKHEALFTSPTGMQMKIGERELITFCSNNYLGLANHPRIAGAAKKTIDSHGYGLAAARFISGTQDIHKQLERQIAAFHKKDDAILFGSCFDANTGFFETILTADDAVISD